MPKASDVPTQEDVLSVLRRRGCLSLRMLCAELWPHLRWRPLLSAEDSIAEGILPDGSTRAGHAWECLGDLLQEGRVRACGRDPDEVDEWASVSFEILGQRCWVRGDARPRT
jgi:hypothetical protein